MKKEFKKRPSDIHSLAKEMHQRSREAGFWETDWSNEHQLCLIISELIEAVEADRNNKTIRLENISAYKFKESMSIIADESLYPMYFKERIKDTVEDELADSVIRLLDLAGSKNLDIGRFALSHVVSKNNSFTENIFSICKELAYYKHSLSEQINYAILEIEQLCKIMSIDLWLHIELKMRYNLTREYKHGKKY